MSRVLAVHAEALGIEDRTLRDEVCEEGGRKEDKRSPSGCVEIVRPAGQLESARDSGVSLDRGRRSWGYGQSDRDRNRTGRNVAETRGPSMVAVFG